MGVTRTRNPAFTLVELTVASVIVALIAGATATAVSQLLQVRAKSAARQQAFSRADAAASRIALDAVNLVRNHELAFTRLSIADSGEADRDEVLMLVRSMRPVRGGEETAEGGEYEVQYRIAPLSAIDPTPALWRRADPAFDAAQDAGGVASPVVQSVTSLTIEANDGESWFEEWESDTTGLPHAIRVTVRALADNGRFEAVARRVIAIDRVPIPPVTSEDAVAEEPAATGSAP